MITKKSYTERLVPFIAGDGMALNLIHVRGAKTADKGPVLLVHGAGVRANIFRAPVETSIVDVLIDAGYEVWLENWRASIDVPANEWTLDQAALFDHPQAVKKVIAESGAKKIKAIIHCQGSTSFTMAAVAGLLPEVETIISNAVSLHPVVPWISKQKLRYTIPLVARLTPYLNPHWGVEASDRIAKSFVCLVRLTHHECNNDVCKLVSFCYGTGFPTLWRHENLNEQTHEWLKQEFKEVPLSFFKQIYQSVKAGHLLSVNGFPELPSSFIAKPPHMPARFAFFSGDKNICFLPESQRRSFEYFDKLRPGFHSLTIIPGYGHLDIFMGKQAAKDVFPAMLRELEKTGETEKAGRAAYNMSEGCVI